MPVIFNGYAFIQAIIAVACLGILQLLMKLFHLDYDMLGGTREAIFSLQFMAFISAYTDSKGLKGRLFLIPTWFALILGSLIFFHLDPVYQTGERGKIMLILYSLSVFNTLFYFSQSKKDLQKAWAQREMAMNLLKDKIQQGPVNEKEYWQLASHVYYRPSLFFLYAYPVWKILFRNAIDAEVFFQHYKYFLNSIKMEEVMKEKHKAWVREIKETFNNASSFKNYSHEPYSIARLGFVIDDMNAQL